MPALRGGPCCAACVRQKLSVTNCTKLSHPPLSSGWYKTCILSFLQSTSVQNFVKGLQICSQLHNLSFTAFMSLVRLHLESVKLLLQERIEFHASRGCGSEDIWGF